MCVSLIIDADGPSGCVLVMLVLVGAAWTEVRRLFRICEMRISNSFLCDTKYRDGLVCDRMTFDVEKLDDDI